MIQAIETRYKGYRFRSRLEARWAVFFDALGVEWRYETEGFDLGDGLWYLPDFLLPEQQCWIEIKGKPPTDRELLMAKKFCLGSEEGEVHVFVGDPYSCFVEYDPYEGSYISFTTAAHESALQLYREVLEKHGDTYAQRYLVDYSDRSADEKDEYGIVDTWPEGGWVFTNFSTEEGIFLMPDVDFVIPEVERAALLAREARFEHGETPRV